MIDFRIKLVELLSVGINCVPYDLKKAAKDIKLIHKILDIAMGAAAGQKRKNKYTAFYIAVTEAPGKILDSYQDCGYGTIISQSIK